MVFGFWNNRKASATLENKAVDGIKTLPWECIASMLEAGQRLHRVDGSNQWSPLSPEVAALVGQYWGLKTPGLESFADWHAASVNAKLRAAGFDNIQLTDKGPGTYMASTIAIRDTWLVEGSEASLKVGGTSVPGFSMFVGEQTLSTGTMGDVSFCRISAKENAAYLVPTDVTGIRLSKLMQEIVRHPAQVGGYDGVIVPDVDHADEADLLPVLDGARLGKTEIGEAKAAVIIKMNKTGFLAKAAASAGAFESVRSAPRKPLIFDRPFAFCVVPQGSTLPLCISSITPASFKSPMMD